MTSSGLNIVKVGGSLYGLPDLGTRLQTFFNLLGASDFWVVPGGGPVVDLVRSWDSRYCLGEEKSHWLALRALTFNAWFLAGLIPGGRVIQNFDDRPETNFPRQERSPDVRIVDLYSWALGDEKNPDHLPHTWEVTSDSLAARLAIQAHAAQLILLKSVEVSPEKDWTAASVSGRVDPFFPKVLKEAGPDLQVRIVNLGQD